MSWFTGASDALEQALVEREVQKRQAMLDALKKQESEREFGLRKSQEARIAADSRRNFEALEHERESDRVAREVEFDLPEDEIDAAAAARRIKHGFGGSIRRTPATSTLNVVTGLGPSTPDNPLGLSNEPANASFTPGRDVARGGARFLSAQAAAQARADQAAAAQAAAKERADADRASREALARDGNATRAAIAREGAAGRAQAAAEKRDAAAQKEADKKAEKQAEVDKKRQAVVYSANQTLDTLDELLVPVTDADGNVSDYDLAPGVSGVVGATMGARWIPGTKAADAEATIQRLNARLVVDLLAEMKAQSRTGATGFGALSEKELRILEGAAAKLSTNQSEASFKRELLRVREMVNRIVQDQPAAAGSSGARTAKAPDPLGIR